MNGNIIPGSDICPVNIPVKLPEQTVGEFFSSKAQDEKAWNPPDWDVKYDIKLDLLCAKKDFVQSTVHLNLIRQKYSEYRENSESDWKQIAEKEESLRQTFVLFHKFIKENIEKKERAKRTIEEEEKIHVRRDIEIENIKKNIAKLTTVKEKMSKSIADLKLYENYLDSVTGISSEYRSVEHILNRYDGLSFIRKELIEKQNKGLDKLEEERKHLLKFTIDTAGTITGMNTHLAQIEKRHTKAKADVKYWENIVFQVKKKTAYKFSKIFQVRDSIWSLYVQMCKRKDEEILLDKDNLEDMLLYIRGTLIEYGRIVKIASKKLYKSRQTLPSISENNKDRMVHEPENKNAEYKDNDRQSQLNPPLESMTG